MLGPVTHHQNLAQGLAIQALRAARSGLTDRHHHGTRAVARRHARIWNVMEHPRRAQAFDATVERRLSRSAAASGNYPWAAQSIVGPFVKDGDMAITHQPIDFLGVNYYSPTYIKFDKTNPSYIGPGLPPKGVELDAFGREIDPSGLGEMLTRLRDDYGNPRVLITEQQLLDPFSAKAPAILDDTFRIDYLRRHLEAVKSAMEQGSSIGGYFVWTLIDNWEWDQETSPRNSALCAMDRKTGVRTTKSSYEWMKTLAKTGRLPKAEGTA